MCYNPDKHQLINHRRTCICSRHGVYMSSSCLMEVVPLKGSATCKTNLFPEPCSARCLSVSPVVDDWSNINRAFVFIQICLDRSLEPCLPLPTGAQCLFGHLPCHASR